MSILNEAIRLYKKGEYHKSLSLFEKAGEIYDASWVKANIILCKTHCKLLMITLTNSR